jgi:hypothetical protein
MTENDNIDIGVIFFKITTWIKNKFALYINVIKKQIILIICFTILGALAGGLFYSLARPFYKTEMVLTSRALSNEYCKYLINNLNENPDVFTERLHVNAATAQQIAEIEYAKFDPKMKESKDSLSSGMPFKIKLTVYNPSVIDTLETSIINFLENNEYALKRRQIELANNKKMMGKLQSELLKLDSLKSLIAKKLGSKEEVSGIIVGNQVDPVNAYNTSLSLYRQELQISSDLMIPENINVIEGFTRKNQPSLSLMIYLIEGFLLGFICSFLIALRIEKRKATV